MNLKYNRIDMKKKNLQAIHSIKLKNRPTSAKRQIPLKNKHPDKKKRKGQKKIRQFGVDITNQPTATGMEEQKIPIVCATLVNEDQNIETTQNEINKYFNQIVDHISLIDEQYFAKMSAKLQQKRQFQTQITEQLRKSLVKWLLYIRHRLRIGDQTMHICVQLIDHFLVYETQNINKDNYQLLGVACLFVASKYNEIYIYQIEKYAFECDQLFNIQQILDMEAKILISINFNLQIPIVHQFGWQHIGCEINDQLALPIATISNLILLDFKLCNHFKKKQLWGLVLYFASKLVNKLTIKSRDIMEKCSMDDTLFSEGCFRLIRLYRESKGLL